MNNRLARFFTLSSLPIGVKLLLLFGAALLILSIPAVQFVRAGVLDLGLQNAQGDLSRLGTRQANAIADAIVSAQTTVDNFLANGENLQRVTAALVGEVNTSSGIDINLPPADINQLINLLQSTLLNPTITRFEDVRLLDRDGVVVARASLNTGVGVQSQDESNTTTYRVAVTANLAGESALLTVTPTGESAVLEYVNAIRWRSGVVLGYFIVRLSNPRTFYANMESPNDFPTALSYVATNNGQIIVESGARRAAQNAFSRDLILRSLSGDGSTTTFAGADGRELAAFYTVVPETTLTLVTTQPLQVAYGQALDYFSVRLFVLVVGGTLLFLIVVALLNQMIAPPLVRLRRAAEQLAEGNLDAPIMDVDRGDEIGQLAGAVAGMRETVRSLVDDLQARVAARTRDIATTADISRAVVTQRDMQALMEGTVNLLAERFSEIYHAQVFLLDSDGAYAVLRASTGEPGKRLLERGHRLAVGSLSVIGQVTDQGRVVLARDTATSQVHRRNEFLPDTRAELALPLRIGERIIGALDVQSREPDVFTDDLISVLSTIAEQLAIAIQNARLFDNAAEKSTVVETSNRDATLRAWHEMMRRAREPVLTREVGVKGGIKADGGTPPGSTPLRDEALKRGELVVGTPTERQTIPVAVPIILRGQALGAVEWELPAQGFGEEKLELARELASRLALSLENARLFQESRQATERERIVNNIAARLTAQTSIDSILQIAVKEVGQATRAPQVQIKLRGEEN